MTGAATDFSDDVGHGVRRARGTEVFLVRIEPSGDVRFYGAVVAGTDSRGCATSYAVRIAATNPLGTVDPDDPSAYLHAENLFQHAGWRRWGAWTTVARWPACVVVPRGGPHA